MTEHASPLTPDLRLAEIATTHAGASGVLQRYRLDFCCGGQRDLASACGERGIDPGQVLAEIAAGEAGLAQDFERWDSRGADALIDHILAQFHEPHRQELVRLVRMALRVEQVHRRKTSCPAGLAGHLARMKNELELHMQKEEQVLFPLIRSGRGAMARVPVQVMEAEHRDHARNLETLQELTSDYTPPAEACTTWRALFLDLSALERDIRFHIHLENNVLFPKALHGGAQ